MLDKKVFCKTTPLINYTARVWRMVESQETAATLSIVDTMEEQAVLEELLDQVKPPYREGTQGMHYLLKTAFRYPPLRHGSRFGTRLMPSFFYASEKPLTALAETAYYRFVFLSDMAQPYEQQIDSSHTMFSVTVTSDKCLDLMSARYEPFRKSMAHPSDYRFCQSIGAWAVNEASVQMIRAESARLPASFNVAVAKPQVIRSRKPNGLESWLCRTTASQISFSSRQAGALHNFSFDQFCIDGVLPRPA